MHASHISELDQDIVRGELVSCIRRKLRDPMEF